MLLWVVLVFGGLTYAVDVTYTISGLSAGASMSAIHAVIYSEYVAGAGIIAGSPYGCQILPHAQNFTCSYDRPNMDLEALWKYTTQRATDGFINPLETMRRTKFYFYSGTKDIVVSQTEMNQTMQFYKHYTDD
eukprot:UN27129